MKTKRIEFVESPNRNLVFWFFSIFTALGLFLAKMNPLSHIFYTYKVKDTGFAGMPGTPQDVEYYVKSVIDFITDPTAVRTRYAEYIEEGNWLDKMLDTYSILSYLFLIAFAVLVVGIILTLIKKARKAGVVVSVIASVGLIVGSIWTIVMVRSAKLANVFEPIEEGKFKYYFELKAPSAAWLVLLFAICIFITGLSLLGIFKAIKGAGRSKEEAALISTIERIKVIDNRVSALGLQASTLESKKNAEKYALRVAAINEEIATLKEEKAAIIASNKEKSLDEMSGDLVLEIRNLSIRFGGLKAVDNLSFDIKEKEIYGLIGPNGAGKTTVFNCITQFYHPNEGTVLFRTNKGNVENLVGQKSHNIISKGLVRTFQNVELTKTLSIIDNVMMGAHIRFKSDLLSVMLHLPNAYKEENALRAKAEDILKSLGLYEIKDMFVAGQPYGVMKKVELARTLMSDPKLIILDEPAAGLNDSETIGLIDIIKTIRDEYDCAILLVEHDMRFVNNVCDRICAICFGKLLAIGTPEEIQKNEAVQEAYLGKADD